MREIKFRGKTTSNNVWVKGYYFRGFTGISYILVMHDHILKVTEFYEVDPATVGQYTGLKDKNGKKIYEGDVLGREGFWCHYVGFKEASFVAIPCNHVQRLNWRWHPISRYVVEDWEIIGNIHDNPELLEGEDNTCTSFPNGGIVENAENNAAQ